MYVDRNNVPQAMLKLHHQRMKHSASVLGFAWHDEAFVQAIQSACASLDNDYAHRLRLSLTLDGVFQTQIISLEPLPEVLDFAIYPERTHSQNPILAHKTTMRQLYNRALAQAKFQGLFDCIFLNEQGEVTEGARSCIFVQLNAQWYTPPLSCGVLPSVQRAYALNDASFSAQERVLTLDDLRQAQAIRLGNALYGLCPARWVAP